jgi:hypothetical protein
MSLDTRFTLSCGLLMPNLHFFSGSFCLHSVPQSIIANQLNLLYICSDNLSFFGAYLQNGCIAVTSNIALLEIALRNINDRS